MNPIKLEIVLEKLQNQFLSIKASAVITSQGTMLANTLNSNVDNDDFAALISALNIFSSKTTKSVNLGKPLELFIQCAEQNIIITETIEGLLLVVLVNSDDLFELDLPAVQTFVSEKYFQ